jgi:uncharacterized damage-inducible protein DinB
MYRQVADFVRDWAYESEMTVKVFEGIPDEKKSNKLNENVRTLERLAWHITQTLSEMPTRAGLLEQDSLEHVPVPATFREITDIYSQQSKLIAQRVSEKWKDKDLEDKVEMYGEQWEKGTVLSILIRHQAHHRAQMTTIMRMSGLTVPGIYGPSKEEWSKYGMPAME